MAYDARIIANEVIRAAWQENYDLTQIDLQKICYFLHGHHLREYGEPLINSEFEAWDFGPVQRSLYDSFRKFGRSIITELATSFDPIKRSPRELPRLDSNTARETIAKHLHKYIGLKSFDLVNLTHELGTPWSITRENGLYTVNLGMKITDALIIQSFEGLELP